jgi:transcriptional regulator with XRE-family HTH domain
MGSISRFGQRLQELRSIRGVSAKFVAERAGIPRSTYAGWELGIEIRDEPYARLAEALGVSISELITGEREPDVKLLLRRLDDLVRRLSEPPR